MVLHVQLSCFFIVFLSFLSTVNSNLNDEKSRNNGRLSTFCTGNWGSTTLKITLDSNENFCDKYLITLLSNNNGFANIGLLRVDSVITGSFSDLDVVMLGNNIDISPKVSQDKNIVTITGLALYSQHTIISPIKILSVD